MTKIHSRLMVSTLSLLLLSLVGAVPASAEEMKDGAKRERFVFQVGAHLAQPAGFHEERVFETSWGTVASLGYNLTDRLSARLSYRFYGVRADLFDRESLVDGSLGLAYETAVVPNSLWLQGELGYFMSRLSATLPGFGDVSQTSHGPLVGVGASYGLTPTLRVGPHVEYVTAVGDLLERGWLNVSLRLTRRF